MEKYVLFFSKVIKISLFRRKERRKYLGTSTPPKSSTGNQCRKIFLYLYQCEKKVLDPKERVTNEILRCNLCGKETPSGNSNLLLHLRHHHPQVDGGKLYAMCTFCLHKNNPEKFSSTPRTWMNNIILNRSTGC